MKIDDAVQHAASRRIGSRVGQTVVNQNAGPILEDDEIPLPIHIIAEAFRDTLQGL
jgi:hypothetical protein